MRWKRLCWKRGEEPGNGQERRGIPAKLSTPLSKRSALVGGRENCQKSGREKEKNRIGVLEEWNENAGALREEKYGGRGLGTHWVKSCPRRKERRHDDRSSSDLRHGQASEKVKKPTTRDNQKVISRVSGRLCICQWS